MVNQANAYSSGAFIVDQAQALAAARTYLAHAGYQGTRAAGGDPVDPGDGHRNRADPGAVDHRHRLDELHRLGDRIAGHRRDGTTGMRPASPPRAAGQRRADHADRPGGRAACWRCTGWAAIRCPATSRPGTMSPHAAAPGQRVRVPRRGPRHQLDGVGGVHRGGAIEAQAALRGRRAPRLRLGGLQNAAGWLVALAALAFSSQPAVALASTPPASAVTVGASSPPARRPGADHRYPAVAATPGSRSASPPAAQVMSMGFYQLVTVQRAIASGRSPSATSATAIGSARSSSSTSATTWAAARCSPIRR